MKKMEFILGTILFVGGLVCTGIGYSDREKNPEKLFPRALLYGGLITTSVGAGLVGRNLFRENEKNYTNNSK